MSTVAEKRCELETLLHLWPDDDWDRQMQADAEPGGKLHQMMSAFSETWLEIGSATAIISPSR
jgi:hypothetical protein